MRIEGAAWSYDGLVLNDGQPHALDTTYISWRKKGSVIGNAQTVNLPVYLNADRASVLFSVDLETAGCDQAETAQRGVCLTAL